LILFKSGRYSKDALIEVIVTNKQSTRIITLCIAFILMCLGAYGLLDSLLFFFQYIPLIGGIIRTGEIITSVIFSVIGFVFTIILARVYYNLS
jgi:hypothetical protein